METNKILQGNCIEVLQSLPDNSIDCCITSPPYYGLRDYGTGTWVGGDPNCNHIADGFNNNRNFINEDGRGGNNPSIGGHVCKLCGAVKEDKQIGLEDTPEEYVQRLVAVFQEVKRVLKADGTLWVNIGDSYNGSGGNHKANHKNDSGFQGVAGVRYGGRGNNIPNLKPKDLIGIPWLLAFALRNDGWYLRQDIIWHKPNPMPEPAKDRCVKSHEYIFLLSKSPKYYFDYEAIQEASTGGGVYHGGGHLGAEGSDILRNDTDRRNTGELLGVRNKRDVWSVLPSHYKEAHFATFPTELIEPMVLAGCPKGGVVLDPFMGSGTTAVVAKQNSRNYLGIELNPEYVAMAEHRVSTVRRRLI